MPTIGRRTRFICTLQDLSSLDEGGGPARLLIFAIYMVRGPGPPNRLRHFYLVVVTWGGY